MVGTVTDVVGVGAVVGGDVGSGSGGTVVVGASVVDVVVGASVVEVVASVVDVVELVVSGGSPWAVATPLSTGPAPRIAATHATTIKRTRGRPVAPESWWCRDTAQSVVALPLTGSPPQRGAPSQTSGGGGTTTWCGPPPWIAEVRHRPWGTVHRGGGAG